jgi:hypothetical protein
MGIPPPKSRKMLAREATSLEASARPVTKILARKATGLEGRAGLEATKSLQGMPQALREQPVQKKKSLQGKPQAVRDQPVQKQNKLAREATRLEGPARPEATKNVATEATGIEELARPEAKSVHKASRLGGHRASLAPKPWRASRRAPGGPDPEN